MRLLSFLSVSAGTWTALSLFRGFPACLLMPSTRQLLSRPHLHLETGPEVGCDLPKTTEHGGPRAGSGPDAPASPPAGALQWRDLSLGRAGCGARGEGGRAAGSSGASLPTRSGVSVSRVLDTRGQDETGNGGGGGGSGPALLLGGQWVQAGKWGRESGCFSHDLQAPLAGRVQGEQSYFFRKCAFPPLRLPTPWRTPGSELRELKMN